MNARLSILHPEPHKPDTLVRPLGCAWAFISPRLTFILGLFFIWSITACNAETPVSSPAKNPDTTPGTAVLPLVPEATRQAKSYEKEREAMVKFQIEERGVSDPLVLSAMRSVPRHAFVPEDYLGLAYSDQPLPIGFGQTISQPYIVALMTAQLELTPGDRVLEIGTGSGYQAAILTEMGMETYTVEIIPELASAARDRMNTLGYQDVHVLTADGYFGWDEFAPYNAIIVTASPDHLPQPLLNQLVPGGHMVIPIGPIGAVQTLWRFTKTDSDLITENLGPVRFVPFTRSK